MLQLGAVNTVNDIVEKYQKATDRRLANGARLISHAPHVAPEAYLHVIFAPLKEPEIKKLEQLILRPLPDELKRFYNYANGAWFFSGALSIDGLRLNQSREGDNAYQPFSMEIPNIDERPGDAKDSYVFLGGYDWDGSLLYIDNSTGKVFRCARESTRPLNEWRDLTSMLTMELSRLAKMFCEDGHPLDPDIPTTPNKSQ